MLCIAASGDADVSSPGASVLSRCSSEQIKGRIRLAALTQLSLNNRVSFIHGTSMPPLPSWFSIPLCTQSFTMELCTRTREWVSPASGMTLASGERLWTNLFSICCGWDIVPTQLSQAYCLWEKGHQKPVLCAWQPVTATHTGQLKFISRNFKQGFFFSFLNGAVRHTRTTSAQTKVPFSNSVYMNQILSQPNTSQLRTSLGEQEKMQMHIRAKVLSQLIVQNYGPSLFFFW